MSTDRFDSVRRAWANAKPGHFMGRGHPIGDFLEAHEWRVLEEEKGRLRLQAHLPKHVRNLWEQLFGGFTGTYVDFVALHTVRAGTDRSRDWSYRLATTNMRIDYFDPVLGPHFILESQLLKERGRTCFVEVRFLDAAGHLCVFALVTMRKLALAAS
jgi:acyl-coenzyme A thioesterase PaaI-like protein